MSPACIAQFLGSAVSFSTSEFANAAPGHASSHAEASAPKIHELFDFIRPPRVIALVAAVKNVCATSKLPAFDPSRRRGQFLPAKVQSQCSNAFRIRSTRDTATKVEYVALK